MILLNTTFYVHPDAEADFLAWVMTGYAPSASRAGLSNPTLSRLLASPGEDVVGYAFHAYAEALPDAEAWHDGEGASQRARLTGRLGGERVLSFSTFMEVIPLDGTEGV